MTVQFRLFLAALALLSLAGLCVRADAGDLAATWTHPTQFEDGSALALGQIASTRLEWGSCAGTAFGTKLAEASVPAPATSYTVTGLSPGTYCLRLYTRTTAAAGGLESAPTGVVSKVIPFPAPKPPVFVTVAVVVFEAKIHPVQGLVAGRQVGTIKLGARCYADANGMQYAGADLYRVPLSSVRLSKTPRSELLIAKCGVKS